jgi:predicted PurR-regulated permease PerM
MVSETPKVAERLHDRFGFVEDAVSRIGAVGHQLERLGEVSDGGSQRVVVAQPGFLASAAGTLADLGITLGAALILTFFLLAWGDAMRTKLIHVLPNLSDKKRSLRVVLDIESEVSRYLLTIVAINAGVGLFVGLAMMIYGMPNPVLWAMAAFLLNFIPFIGTLAGQLVMFAVGTVTFPTLFQAAFPALTYLLIGIIEGSFVTPSVLGRRLELNPVAILIVLALTTWMWGLVGTVIGVPILVVIKVFSAHFAGLSHLAEFISAEAPVEELAPDDASIMAGARRNQASVNSEA